MPTETKKSATSHQRRFSNIRISTVIMAILIIGLVWSLICPPYKNVADAFSGQPGKTPEIIDDVILRQEFRPDKDYDFFGIFFLNYLNFFQKGKIFIEVSNDHRDTQQFEYAAKSLKNEAYIYVNCSLTAGEQYVLEIKTQGIDKGKDFTFSTIKTADQPPLYLNGEQQDNTLFMTFIHKERGYFVAWYFILGITLTALYMALQTNKERYEKSK